MYTLEVALVHMRELQERAERRRVVRLAAATRTKARSPRAKKH